jgi:hypothetical protein
MKDDEEANMRLMASSGPIAIKVSEEMLIDSGILAKPYFKYVTLTEHHPKLYRTTGWQRAGVRIEQHLVALRGIGRQQECATGTELGVGGQNLAVNATHHQPFLAPVKLEGFTQFKLKRDVGRFAGRGGVSPAANKISHDSVTASETVLLDGFKHH